MILLRGIRIVDFSKYLPGPYASLRLADKGAEVIVIEPLEGEPSRNLGLKKDEESLLYLANNRNKKSFSVNLKDKEGRDLVLQLIEKADVVIESFRPSVMKKLGLDYETVKKIKPDIIYCSISGYGQEGELSHLGSHDLNYLAISGVLAQLKDENNKPVVPSIQLADHLGAFQCTEEILAALVKRYQLNEGSYIDLSLVDPLISIMGTNHFYFQEGNEKQGVPDLRGDLYCYSIYETKDQRFVVLGALEPKFWKNFCDAVNRPDWYPYQLNRKCDDNHFGVELNDLFKSKTLAEWLNFACSVDCCMSPVLEVGEVEAFAYMKDRKLYNTINDNRHVSTYYQQELKNTIPPPRVGQHTREVLTTILNLSKEEITDLKHKNVIRSEE